MELLEDASSQALLQVLTASRSSSSDPAADCPGAGGPARWGHHVTRFSRASLTFSAGLVVDELQHFKGAKVVRELANTGWSAAAPGMTERAAAGRQGGGKGRGGKAHGQKAKGPGASGSTLSLHLFFSRRESTKCTVTSSFDAPEPASTIASRIPHRSTCIESSPSEAVTSGSGRPETGDCHVEKTAEMEVRRDPTAAAAEHSVRPFPAGGSAVPQCMGSPGPDCAEAGVPWSASANPCQLPQSADTLVRCPGTSRVECSAASAAAAEGSNGGLEAGEHASKRPRVASQADSRHCAEGPSEECPGGAGFFTRARPCEGLGTIAGPERADLDGRAEFQALDGEASGSLYRSGQFLIEDFGDGIEEDDEWHAEDECDGLCEVAEERTDHEWGDWGRAKRGPQSELDDADGDEESVALWEKEEQRGLLQEGAGFGRDDLCHNDEQNMEPEACDEPEGQDPEPKAPPSEGMNGKTMVGGETAMQVQGRARAQVSISSFFARVGGHQVKGKIARLEAACHVAGRRDASPLQRLHAGNGSSGFIARGALKVPGGMEAKASDEKSSLGRRKQRGAGRIQNGGDGASSGPGGAGANANGTSIGIASGGPNAAARHCPMYKRVSGTRFAVDAFSYGAIRGVDAYCLSHFHSDHYGGLSRHWSHGPIYCSHVTAALTNMLLGVDNSWLRPLPWNQTTQVQGGVRLTLLPANHCPGAALLLFMLPSGATILHTGDFRACTGMQEYPHLARLRVDTLYLDTTYCSPRYVFPSQEEVIGRAVEFCVGLQREKERAREALAGTERPGRGGKRSPHGRLSGEVASEKQPLSDALLSDGKAGAGGHSIMELLQKGDVPGRPRDESSKGGKLHGGSFGGEAEPGAGDGVPDGAELQLLAPDVEPRGVGDKEVERAALAGVTGHGTPCGPMKRALHGAHGGGAVQRVPGMGAPRWWEASQRMQAAQPLFAVGSYSIGKERFYLALAEALGVQICVEKRRLRTLHALDWPELSARLTTDPTATPLHVLPLGHIRPQRLHEYVSRFGARYGVAVGFRPTGWTFSEKFGSQGAPGLKGLQPQQFGRASVYGIPYSEHSSFAELKDFVQFLRPKQIVPTVNVGRGEAMQAIFASWLAE